MTTLQEALYRAKLIDKKKLEEHEKRKRWEDSVDRKKKGAGDGAQPGAAEAQAEQKSASKADQPASARVEH